MDRITPEDAARYRSRWLAVARREAIELRSTTLLQKLRQLDALFAARGLFPPEAPSEREARDVMERWRLIRAAFNAG